MKKWLETRQVLDRLAELRSEGRRSALATVVRVRGSAYRHEGAKMLVVEDGSTVGNVSGGCLEADVREVALRVLETGTAERREYCGSADEIEAWDLGVGCEGVVEVSVQGTGHGAGEGADGVVGVAGTAGFDPYEAVRGRLDGDRPFAWCVDIGSGNSIVVGGRAMAGSLGSDTVNSAIAARAGTMIEREESGIIDEGGREIFIDVFTPPPTLLIIGRGDDVTILARLAAEVGFDVANVAELPDVPARSVSSASSSRFGVVMSHHYAKDRDALRILLREPIEYIGMLGPRQRTERMLAELAAEGPVDESRVYAPVGLDIGTDGAEQVAMSIIAEILAVRSGRRPASLRERRAPIHASVAE